MKGLDEKIAAMPEVEPPTQAEIQAAQAKIKASLADNDEKKAAVKEVEVAEPGTEPAVHDLGRGIFEFDI